MSQFPAPATLDIPAAGLSTSARGSAAPACQALRSLAHARYQARRDAARQRPEGGKSDVEAEADGEVPGAQESQQADHEADQVEWAIAVATMHLDYRRRV